jgi:hypothetical protein
MKTFFSTLVCAVVLINMVIAQTYEGDQPTALFSSGSKVTGWFVETQNASTHLNHHYANSPGFAAGLVMNNNFMVGVAGKSFGWYESNLKFNDILQEPCYLNGGYGGLYLDYAPDSHKVLHISIPVLIGGGGATYLSDEKYPEWDEDELDYSRKELSASPFFVFEPGANMVLNLTGFLKVYAGYSYRWINGLTLDNTNHNALNGSNFKLGIKIGKF